MLTQRDKSETHFDAGGKITSRVDRNGNTTSYTYDTTFPDRLIEIGYQDGSDLTLAYDSSGRLSTVTDRTGATTTLGYSGSTFELIKVTQPDPDGAGPLAAAETDFSYHGGSGLLASVTDDLSQVTSFAQDAFGKLTSITDASSAVYSIQSQVSVDAVTPGSTSVSSPTSLPDATPEGSLTDPLSHTQSMAFDAWGQMLRSTDALGNTTTIDRDANGFAIEMTTPDPDGSGPLTAATTDVFRGPRNNPLRINNPDGTDTALTFHADWNVPERIVTPDGRDTIRTLDARGNITESRVVIGYDDAVIPEGDDLVTSYTYTSAPLTSSDLPGGLLLTETDPRGYVTEYSYGTTPSLGSFGQLISVTAAAGTAAARTISLAYDSDRRLISQTDPTGAVTQYTYDDLGRLTQTTYADPDGAGPLTSPVVSVVYDSLGRIIEATDPLGNTSYQSYNFRDQVTLVTHADGTTDSYAYDLAGRLTSHTDQMGSVFAYAYDAAGRMTLITRPDPDPMGPYLPGTTISIAYDNLGRAISQTDPRGNVTEISYDSMDRPLSMTLPDPDGSGPLTSPVYSYTYGDGQLTRATDPTGHSIDYEYDDAGRLERSTQFVFDSSTGGFGFLIHLQTYDEAGNVTAQVDGLGNATNFAYDELGQLTSQTLPDPDGSGSLTSPLVSYTYDAAGRVETVTDPRGGVTTFAYDALGRRTSTTGVDPDGAGPLAAPVSSLAYDVAGRVTSATDPLGEVTSFTYDVMGRVLTQSLPDPDGAGPLSAPTTTFAYDNLGRTTSLTDPVGNLTSWTYDRLSRLTGETSPLGATETYDYDDADRLIEITDRRGWITEYSYDELGRLTTEEWLSGGSVIETLSFEYDSRSNLTKTTTSELTETFGYDELSRLTSRETDFAAIGSVNFLQSSAYDLGSRRTSLALQTGSATSAWSDDLTNEYTYDALSRMTSVTQTGTAASGDGGGGDSPGGFGGGPGGPGGGTSAVVADKHVTFSYDSTGQFESIVRYDADLADSSAKIAQTDFTYDSASRLTTLSHTKDAPLGGTTTIADYDYTYDVGNRITSIASTSLVAGSNTSTYSYDATHQVTGATHTAAALANETFAYDENGNPSTATIGTWNRLLADGTFNYTYDANGNRTGRTRISSAAADDYETIYSWDHRNRLTSITIKDNLGAVTRQIDYAYNAFDERIEKVIDLDGAGIGTATTERYVYDGGDILVVVDDAGAVEQRMLHGPAVDQILAIEETSSGDVSWALTDHLGSVRDVIDSSGNVLNRIDYDTFGGIADESDPAEDFFYGYTGRDRDEESGLNYHRARYFDPTTDRWMSQDPIRFSAGDTNLYRYVGNSATVLADPSGLSPFHGISIVANPSKFGEYRYADYGDVFDFYGIDVTIHYYDHFDRPITGFLDDGRPIGPSGLPWSPAPPHTSDIATYETWNTPTDEKQIQWAMALISLGGPGGDVNDALELATGQDIHGNSLTGPEYGVTVVGAAVPFVGAEFLRRIVFVRRNGGVFILRDEVTPGRQIGDRMTSGDDALQQLSEIEVAQRNVRQGKAEQIIDSIEKSKQRAKNQLDGIRNLDDLDDYDY
ncbi:MAG: RHS repeat-associated core domain-containing protein [Planctomycetota bacterium]